MSFIFAITLPGLICALIVFAALERMALWAGKLSWVPWRRNQGKRPLSSIGFEEVNALFYATKHYELEHRKEERQMRDDEAEGAPPRTKIDLEAGTAVIKLPGS